MDVAYKIDLTLTIFQMTSIHFPDIWQAKNPTHTLFFKTEST